MPLGSILCGETMSSLLHPSECIVYRYIQNVTHDCALRCRIPGIWCFLCPNNLVTSSNEVSPFNTTVTANMINRFFQFLGSLPAAQNSRTSDAILDSYWPASPILWQRKHSEGLECSPRESPMFERYSPCFVFVPQVYVVLVLDGMLVESLFILRKFSVFVVIKGTRKCIRVSAIPQELCSTWK